MCLFVRYCIRKIDATHKDNLNYQFPPSVAAPLPSLNKWAALVWCIEAVHKMMRVRCTRAPNWFLRMRIVILVMSFEFVFQGQLHSDNHVNVKFAWDRKRHGYVVWA
jgi:hypothetical protein